MEQPDKKAVVPKFGSFKLKTIHSPKANAKDDEKSLPRHHRSRSRQRDSRSHRPQHGHHHAQYHPNGSRHSSAEPRKTREAPPTDEFEESNSFIIDRRGDSKNVEFGSLHRYSVPAYHRTGLGRVIGSTNGDKIDRDESSEKAVVFREWRPFGTERASRSLLSDKSRRYKDGNPVLRIVRAAASAPLEDELNADFITLRKPSFLKRKRSTGSIGTINDQPDYRSIEGDAKAVSAPDDDDLQYASDSDLDQAQDDLQAHARLRSAELLRKTKEQPKSIHGWLELIGHQRTFVRSGVDEESFTAQDRRTLADVRMSIYERALKHLKPSDPGHDQLCAGLLKEGAVIWESSRLASRWDECIAEHAESCLLWKKYLNFVQTQTGSFSFASCKDAYVRCLKALEISSHNNCGHESCRLYVFLRMTAFLRDAGYEELAHSLWQVLLEYFFFRPLGLTFNKTVELEALEDWWEADVPRVGESDAVGWDLFYTHGTKTIRQSSADEGSVRTGRALPRSLMREAQLAGSHFLSATADDDQAESDPFRFVMFSDMKDMVEHMFVGISKDLIVSGWLQFVGLPAVPAMHKDLGCDMWCNDVFLQSASSLSTVVEQATQPPVWNEKVVGPWFQRYLAYDLFLHGPFEPLPQDLATFVDCVVQSLIPRLNNDHFLAEYYLAYLASTCAASNDAAKKLARRLLKTKTDSLRLYNAYALIEVRSGHVDKAIGVWKAALSGISAPQSPQNAEVASLWHSWMLTVVHNRGEEDVLGVLLSMTEDPLHAGTTSSVSLGDISAGKRLRALKWLSEEIGRILMQTDNAQAVLLIDCLAWLTYIVSAHSTEDTLAIYDKYSAKVEACSSLSHTSLELVHEAKARMLVWHVGQKRPYKPAMLRSTLDHSLQLFPENSLIIEARAKIRDGLNINLGIDIRDTIDYTTTCKAENNKPKLVSQYHHIAQAIRRFELGTGTHDSVRNLFFTALENTASDVRCSPTLWKKLLRFELSLVGKQTSAKSIDPLRMVKSVFYKGMRGLPWLKSWAVEGLLAISAFEASGEEDARKILEILEERGIRMRTQHVVV